MYLTGTGPSENLKHLHDEKQQLLSTINHLRRQLEEAVGEKSRSFAEREKEFEDRLDEKSEAIRCLHGQLKGLETAAAARQTHTLHDASDADMNHETLGEELAQEASQLEGERAQLEEERQQLRGEEEGLMGRMKEMERQMSKERADMGRQRNELNDLHQAILADMQQVQQQGVVSNRVGSWQQQLHEVTETRKGRR
jgi:chromosome segregation ATPase